MLSVQSTGVQVSGEKLLRDVDAARKVGKSRSGWLKDCRVGLTPSPVRLGRSVRWSERELDSWIEAGCPPRVRWERIKEASHAV